MRWQGPALIPLKLYTCIDQLRPFCVVSLDWHIVLRESESMICPLGGLRIKGRTKKRQKGNVNIQIEWFKELHVASQNTCSSGERPYFINTYQTKEGMRNNKIDNLGNTMGSQIQDPSQRHINIGCDNNPSEGDCKWISVDGKASGLIHRSCSAQRIWSIQPTSS